MNAAAMARKGKEAHPEDYCAHSQCLWRVRTREGVKPCPKHGDRLAGLAPKTIDLMQALVTSLRNAQGAAPVLSEDELQLIRAKVAGGSFDALDAGALLDHIDYLTDAYEQVVQRSGQEADRAQALIGDREIHRMQVEDAIEILNGLIPDIYLDRDELRRIRRLLCEAIDKDEPDAARAAGATE